MGDQERILTIESAPIEHQPRGTPTEADLYRSPNALAPHYRHFRVDERALLTGHSHQAWPDLGLEGQRLAWLDAAERVDGKWERAFEMATIVRSRYQRLMGDPDGLVALGGSTHELLVRFLSALPLRDRPRVLTTDGEFHTIRRQLDRLEEEGLEVVRVPAHRADQVAPALIENIDGSTAAVFVSSVLYRSAGRVPGLGDVAAACHRVGAELLVDAYHQLNVVPMSLGDDGLEGACIVGGGYKYCQFGEGNCFLRLPADCTLRPIITGWFSEFTALAQPREHGVQYGTGADRFAGSTYDPTSHYRAVAVIDFFEQMNLSDEFLRRVSQHQIRVLCRALDDLDLDPSWVDRDRSTPVEALGGFVALDVPRAAELSRALLERGVHTDYRGATLRLGPAPYLSDSQLTDAVGQLGQVVKELSS